MSLSRTHCRFSRNRVGAAYSLLPDEILQARTMLIGSGGTFCRFLMRVTRDARYEQAVFWIGASNKFTSTSEELPHDVMQQISQALADLTLTAKGYNPVIEANDSGRSIIFWNEEQPMTVFIPNHPAACQPTVSCISAFERLWSIIAKYGTLCTSGKDG